MSIERRPILFFVVFTLALYLLGNGMIPATDPVETNYTQTAKEMLASGDFISPRIFGNFWYDKPVFFYWELIGAFSLFGISDFSARLFPSMFGTVGVLMTYWFAKRIYDKKTAGYAALMLATSFGYWLVSKTIITDMTLFVFFNAVLVFFYIAYTSENKNWYYLCYLFAGLAVLTKGPIGILLPGLVVTIFICVRRDFKEILRMKPLGFVIFAVVVAVWYYPMIVLHGDDFIKNFLGVHNVLRATQSEHPLWNVWWYYSVLFFLIFMPWSFMTLPKTLAKYVKAYRENHELPKFDQTQLFLLIWAITVTLFYQNMATKYTTYTLPTLLPISILGARYMINHDRLFKRTAAVWTICLVALTFLVAIPITRNQGYSQWEAAAYLKGICKPDDLIVEVGDYKVSLTYYSDIKVYRLEPKELMKDYLPDGKSWKAKNFMPFMAMEDLPKDKQVYLLVQEKRRHMFEKYMNQNEWELVRTFPRFELFVRKPQS